MRNRKKYMSLPYNADLKNLARQKRRAGILAEVQLWQQVHKKAFKGYDFDRQKIIGNYIVDLFCLDCGVVIEIDGVSHEEKAEYDADRDDFLRNLGLVVIHIGAKDILSNLDAVMTMLNNHPALNISML